MQQTGLQDRTFSYDSLGRLLSASNPEAGATNYTYDADSNVLTRVRPAPNQSNPAVQVTTTYSWDALNRLLSKTYSDGTPTASYVYDWSSAAGISLTNTVGRLALERTTNASGQTLTEDIFSYDALGRVTSNWQDPGNGPLDPFAYGYDLLGDITQQSQPTDATSTSFTLSGAWNRAGRLTGLSSSYANSATHPSNLLSAVHYDAWGHVTALSTTNGAINETRSYDGRGRLWETRGNPYYKVGEQLYAPDGAVTTLEDAANGNWTYTYDALNRLLAAKCSANCPGGQASLDLDWTYDRLGNRWSQAPTAGVASTASASFTGKNNRMDTDSYDAAGNLLGDGSHTYTYDAENRIVGVGGNATASYAYDAEGRRVSTTTAGGTTLRFFDQQGRTVRRIAAAGQWLSSEIYALGQPLATYDQSGANGMTWFMNVDPLGTIRTITNGSGQFAQACTSLPFGDDQSCSPAISDPSPLHFTGKPRDAETGLDDFGFRYNSSTLGRWMTPDPAGNLVASPANPQSWNQYAYVMNNPATLVDPFGLFGTDPALCSTSAGYAVCPGTVINVTGGASDNGFDPPYVYFGPNNNSSSGGGGGGGGGIVTSSTLRSRLQCAVNWTDGHGPTSELGKLLAGNVVAEVVDLALRATDPGADRGAVAATALGDGVTDAIVDPAKAVALNRSGAAIISGIAGLQEAGQVTTLGLAITIEQSAPEILALAGRDLAGPVGAAMMVYSAGQFAYAYFEECQGKQ